jgi:hypothetical protein
MINRPRGGWRNARLAVASLVTFGTLALGACGKDTGPTEPPVLPPNNPGTPPIKTAAFLFDVDLRSGTVKVTAPEKTLQSLGIARTDAQAANSSSPEFSVVGGDVVELVATGYEVSSGGGFGSGSIPVGPCPGGSPAAVAGRLCVEFDVAVINELLGVQLVGPTVFPTPVPGTTGPLLIPYSIQVTQSDGSVSVGGPQGNDVIGTQPNTGSVSTNDEWVLAPFNFFNDATCSATLPTGVLTDCFRSEEITPTPLAGGAQSDPLRVGFYVDPTVGQFTVTMLVAADLQNQSGAASGTISGTVTSPQLGALSGATLSVSGVAGTQTTDASGAYTFAPVGLGSRTVSVTGGLPASCSLPAAQAATVTNGATSTVNFSVTCAVPTGTIAGTITSSLTSAGLAGVSVIVTPAGGSALAAVTTSAAGAYTRNAVALGTPTGTGAVTLSGLPAGCTDPGSTPYTGLTNGGTVNVNVTVTCVAPPAVYTLGGAWTRPTATTAAYTLTYDLTQRDDPAIPGADDVFVISGTTAFGTLITFTGTANVAGSLLQNQGSNELTPGNIAWQNFTTAVTPPTGLVGIIVFNFTVPPGATGTVTPATTFSPTDDVQSANGTNLLPNTQLQQPSLTLP